MIGWHKMASNQKAKAFIKEIAPLIQKYARIGGYRFPSAIIAQACIESNFGLSSLGYQYHNYFGMKCGNTWAGRSVNLSTHEEYQAGHITNIKANFRVYDTMEAGVRGYFDFIRSTRYANLKNATSAKNYIELLKADGYATSSTYVSTVWSCVTRYDLIEWDEEREQEDIEMKTIKKGSTGKAVKVWQIIVNVTPDGIFGDKTKTATEQFQSQHSLKIDGVVGAESWKAGLATLEE